MSDRNVALRFGKVLKDERKKRGLTQENLAELADMSVEHLQRLEGKSPSGVRLETVVRIAAAFKINPARLLKNF